MRTMIKVQFPVETANKALKDGTLPKTLEAFIQKYKPEASYFFSSGGLRSALFVFDMKDSADIPSLVEPFFRDLDASVSITPVMNAEDLKAGLMRYAGK